jgi:lipoprotein-anchoring transpeptidase ErfK/SrfK
VILVRNDRKIGEHVASQQTTTGSRPGQRRRILGLAAVASAALLALSACTTGAPKHQPGSPVGNQGRPTVTSISTPTAAAVPPATIASPQAGRTIDPVTPVTVTAAGGTLLDVAMRNPAGKLVTGAIADDGSGWHTTEVLGYSKTYRITATAVNSAGRRTTKQLSVSTITPDNMTMPYLNNEYGTSLVNGATYGVGMIAVVHFDEPIPDRAAAEKQLQVTTTPSQPGAWYWLDDQNVHYRPQTFFQPGTKVTISAKVYGHDLGDGLYGQADQSVSFTIGEKHVAIADAKAHQVKVYFNDKLVRTMPTSMGQGGWVDGRNGKISLWTMPGTYTVLGHENPATMSSDSYGLPANSPYGYAPEKVPYATKISTDGIYLHELDSTVWAQGHQNVSHGCLNLNYENAKWYYNTSRVGDVVIVRNSGGPAIKVWQGGDWSVPWSQWLAGSALH